LKRHDKDGLGESVLPGCTGGIDGIAGDIDRAGVVDRISISGDVISWYRFMYR